MKGKGKVSKNKNNENFPVASLFLDPKARSRIIAFYHQARAGDDIADAVDLTAEEKLTKLPLPSDNPFLHDLFIAFRRDCTQNRYDSWQDLLDYCRYSANPVGRFLLDVHAETEGYEESDALCTALQVLNHLQDCQKDFKDINRIYLPKEYLQSPLSFEEELTRNACSPELRKCIDRCLDETDLLIAKAKGLAGKIKNKRLRYQAKVTWLCALALSGKLRRMDPLAQRVELGKLDKFLLAYKGLYPL
jgi:phytoene/squalene synthetase